MNEGRHLDFEDREQSWRDLHKRLVDYHGEVLLLVHWSVLAYTATVKVRLQASLCRSHRLQHKMRLLSRAEHVSLCSTCCRVFAREIFKNCAAAQQNGASRGRID
eukprot:1137454-Pelagomonas_calceolata.AAC.2